MTKERHGHLLRHANYAPQTKGIAEVRELLGNNSPHVVRPSDTGLGYRITFHDEKNPDNNTPIRNSTPPVTAPLATRSRSTVFRTPQQSHHGKIPKAPRKHIMKRGSTPPTPSPAGPGGNPDPTPGPSDNGGNGAPSREGSINPFWDGDDAPGRDGSTPPPPVGHRLVMQVKTEREETPTLASEKKRKAGKSTSSFAQSAEFRAQAAYKRAGTIEGTIHRRTSHRLAQARRLANPTAASVAGLPHIKEEPEVAMEDDLPGTPQGTPAPAPQVGSCAQTTVAGGATIPAAQGSARSVQYLTVQKLGPNGTHEVTGNCRVWIKKRFVPRGGMQDDILEEGE